MSGRSARLCIEAAVLTGMAKPSCNYTQGTTHFSVPVSVIEYEADGSDATLGTTFSVSRELRTNPENCAGGAGSIAIGPASIR